MQVVWVRQPGGIEELELRNMPDPSPGAHEVVIEVKAAALNRADLLQRRGLYPPPPGASSVLGLECAGVVVGCGSSVTGVAHGDRVMALLPGGGYAQFAAVDAGLTLPIPGGMSFTDAAAIPEAFLTAQEALFTLGELDRSGCVLIHAAAGGVGSAAIQLAKWRGAMVVASVGSDDKAQWVRALGADVALNYRNEDFAAIALQHRPAGVSLALDCVGGSYAAQHLRCLSESGRWIVLGLLGGRSAPLDFAQVLRKRLRILGLVMRTRSLTDRTAIVARFRRDWLPAFSTGDLRPLVDQVLPIEQVAQAHERMEQNANLGKIVLTLGSQ
jgi:tumor protein p53-inducible protein 3